MVQKSKDYRKNKYGTIVFFKKRIVMYEINNIKIAKTENIKCFEK